MCMKVVKGFNSMAFFGSYQHNLDDKSRVMIPTKLREGLTTKVYATLGYRRCIYIYTEERFAEICKLVSSPSRFTREVMGFQNTFFSKVDECSLDKQGRILINKNLLKIVSIEKEVVIVGSNDHIEIWDRSHREQVEEEYLENYDSNFEITFSKRDHED